MLGLVPALAPRIHPHPHPHPAAPTHALCRDAWHPVHNHAVSGALLLPCFLPGFVLLVALLLTAWFAAPDVLHPAYKHVKLVFRKQWRLIARIKTFWITSFIIVSRAPRGPAPGSLTPRVRCGARRRSL